MHALINRISAFSFVLFLLFGANVALRAQDNASITGVVTDATGAVVPGTAVTLTNPSRGLTFSATTNNSGSYRFPNVPPADAYVETFSHSGFSSVTIQNIILAVGITQTQDARLSAGSNVTVEITAKNNLVTLNTTDASIGSNFDPEIINDLPIANRNSVAALFFAQPGVTSQGSVTGARTDQTSVTVDGMDVNDISTGQFGNINGGMPVDATQEFRGIVAGLPANLGTGGGAQFQLVTKSGTNKFHGDLNEYHRDTVTTANTWFNKVANPVLPRTPRIQNQFGGAIGGPALRDKLYFFADFNNSRIISSLAGADTVPLDSYRAGNIGYVKTGCSSTSSRQNTTPACIGFLTPTDVKAKDPAGIGEDPAIFALITSRYPHANDLSGGDGVNSGLFRFTQSTLNVLYNGVARVDYNLTSNQRIFLQYHDAHQDSVQAINRFPGDPLTRPFQDRSYGYVASHVWQIGNNKVNQVYVGDNVTVFNFSLAYNPLGTNIIGSLSGVFTTPYDGGNIQRRRVPIPTVRDDFNWTKGAHNISIGGSFKFIKASNYLGNDYNTYTLGLGGNVNTLSGTSLRPSDIQATGTTNTTQYDNAFTLSLGRVARISSIYNFTASGAQLPSATGANRRFRYYQTELYASDSWKVNRQLTLTYGLRYSLYSVPFETLGAESSPNVSFDDYFSARVKQSAAGISGPTSVPLLTYNLVGKANGAPDYYNSNLKDFAPRFAFAFNPVPKTVFNGSVDLVFDRTVANAVNFLQNQSTFLFQNTIATNNGNSSDPTGSLKNDPRVSDFSTLPTAPTTPSPSKPFTPFVSATGVPTGLNTQNTTYVIDKNLKDPYSIAFNFGVQQEFPGRLIMRASYAGRLGRRLLGQTDGSQLIDFPDNTSGQMLSQAFAYATTQIRAGATPNSLTPQPWFENILTPNFYKTKFCATGVLCNSNTAYAASNQGTFINNGDITDALQAFASAGILPSNVGLASQFARDTFFTNKGFSNYNGLLLTVSKNMSHGTKFDFNYTWSHSIDNVSIIANSVANGSGFICDATRPRACRGTSDFDVRHIVTADFIAQLPFGHGRQFASNVPWFIDELIGGWDLAGLPTWQSGFALSTTSSAFLSSFFNNAPLIYIGAPSDDVAMHLHKNASNQLVAFNDPAKALSHFRQPIGIEYGGRNTLRGPSQFYFDLGLSKTFRIIPEDRLNLRFRADAFNVLNHPTFANPNTSFTSSNFGIIAGPTGTNVARVGQFSLRLEF
ncbi:MAG: TonB-dependent receptor [Acidobacteriota bacterium]|nr:TonB-dependent receptor [Acidobacteriota bacterium]